MRLDLFEHAPQRPRLTSVDPFDVASGPSGGALDGTSAVSLGVEAAAWPKPREGRRLGVRGWFVVLVAACTLLGQGEHSRPDRRFRWPSTTLMTYWDALRAGDADLAHACLVEGRREVPLPGTVWFLPETDDLWLTGYNALPISAARMMVSYEVHYRDRATHEERMFRFGNELVRDHGEWRIAKPIGEASMPEWKPKDRAVDS